MNGMLKQAALGVAAIVLVSGSGFAPVGAQQANQQIKRTILQKSDVARTNYETVLGIAEIAPKTEVTSHTHPGTESAYLMEGKFHPQCERSADARSEGGRFYRHTSRRTAQRNCWR